MKELSDAELLTLFCRDDSEDAFSELVARHVNLVYSVAARRPLEAHQAEEITQAVFIMLSRKARSLKPATVLSGWLYHAARLTAANYQRAESRRVRREQDTFMQSRLSEIREDSIWLELAPLLEEAMGGLGRADRDAVVLRYFGNKSLFEVAAALGLEERAAQKRVSRALEKLRQWFARRGVASPVSMIAGAISAHSVHAAPASLAALISSTVLRESAVAGSTLTLVKGTQHIMTWLKTKTALAIAGSALLVVGAGVGIAQYSRTANPAPRAGTAADKERAEADAKLKAEQSSSADGNKNIAVNPNANKLADEQAALAQQNASH